MASPEKFNTGNRSFAGSYEDYQVQMHSAWPPPIFMKKNMPYEQRFYLENRWYGQWQFYDSKASFNKKWYFRLQFIIVVFSVIVPVLVGFGPSLATALANVWPNVAVRTIIDILTVLLSLMVAVAAAVEGLFGYGDNWRTYRTAAEDLSQEKYMFDVGAGNYVGNANPFAHFVERVEDIIAQQNGRWVQKTQQNQAALAAANQEIIDKYREEYGESLDFEERQEITRTERDENGDITTVQQSTVITHEEVADPAPQAPVAPEASVVAPVAEVALAPEPVAPVAGAMPDVPAMTDYAPSADMIAELAGTEAVSSEYATGEAVSTEYAVADIASEYVTVDTDTQMAANTEIVAGEAALSSELVVHQNGSNGSNGSTDSDDYAAG